MMLDGVFEMFNAIKNLFSKKKARERLIKSTLRGSAQAKAMADLNKEPWVSVLSVELNPKDPSQGSFELDWNDLFIVQLKEAGYFAKDDDEIVNKWFTELCQGIARSATEEGNFVADADYLIKQGK